MVMVNQAIPKLNIEGKLVIFPRYTYYLQKQGYTIIQRNEKLSNRKLNEYLMRANLASVLGNKVSLPDFAVYSDGNWKEYGNLSYDAVQLDAGKYGSYIYYTNVLNESGYDEKAINNLIIGFLNLYSSAKLKVNQR